MWCEMRSNQSHVSRSACIRAGTAEWRTFLQFDAIDGSIAAVFECLSQDREFLSCLSPLGAVDARNIEMETAAINFQALGHSGWSLSLSFSKPSCLCSHLIPGAIISMCVCLC